MAKNNTEGYLRPDADPEETPVPFTTLPAQHWPDGELPDGLMYVTPEEMSYLKELSWGEGTFRATCPNGHENVYEKHPADWPNHPGDPGTLRVKLECSVPSCAATWYTEGSDEATFAAGLNAEYARRVQAEVARLMAEESGTDTPIVHVGASETATSDASHQPTTE